MADGCQLFLRLIRRLGLRLVLLRSWRLLHFLAFIRDLHVRSEALVIAVLHDFADAYVAGGKVQLVIGFGVGRKPVLAVDLLSPSGELGKEIFLTPLLANVRDSLAISLHD